MTQVSLLKGVLLVLALIGVVGFMEWQGYSRPLKQVMFMLCLGLGLEALSNSFFVALEVRGRQDLQGKIKVVAAALGFGYGLIALALGAPPLAIAAFKLIESLVNLGGSFFLVRSRGNFRFKWPSLGRMGSLLRLGLVFALIEVSAIIYNKANLFFLQKYAGAAGVAQYSVPWQIVDGLSAIVSGLLLQSVLFPLFVQLWEVDRGKVSQLAQNTSRWLLAVALVVMFVLFIESDRIITLVYGPKYPEALWLQKLLSVTVIFAFMHNLAALLMISMRLQRLLLIFYLGGLAFNLVWCSLVIPRAPLMGAALAMVLTKGGVAVLTVAYCQRRLGLSLSASGVWAHAPAPPAPVGPHRPFRRPAVPGGGRPPAPGSHRSPGPGSHPAPGGAVVAPREKITLILMRLRGYMPAPAWPPRARYFP